MPRPVDDFIYDTSDEIGFANEIEVETTSGNNERIVPISSYWDDMSLLVEQSAIDNDLSDILNQDDLTHALTSESNDEGTPKNLNISPRSSSKKKKLKAKDDNEDSSEEERWLHAIESGKLEEVDDELKKIKPKDPKLMTARQRALLDRKSDKDSLNEELLALPTGYRERVVTPEMQKEKAKKLQKRKQLADEKRESDKKKTMERLLRKSDSKNFKFCKAKSKRLDPRIIYHNKTDSITISLPPGVSFPMTSQISKPLPEIKMCGVNGCKYKKRYTCVKTGVPLCSIECYRLNLMNHALVDVGTC